MITDDPQMKAALDRAQRFVLVERMREFASLCKDVEKSAIELNWNAQARIAGEWREAALIEADRAEGFSTE